MACFLVVQKPDLEPHSLFYIVPKLNKIDADPENYLQIIMWKNISKKVGSIGRDRDRGNTARQKSLSSSV
jgi:hypothetical protein